jgi:hypothetical protein
MGTTNWMKQLSDKLWLRQIVMPGSHDAGVYGTAQVIVRAKPFVNPEYTICQHSDFSRQAMAGSRFFDCRVFLREIPKNERSSPQEKYENRLGHFAKEKTKGTKLPTLGGYGGTLAAVLGQAIDFVISNNSEFIILRFSHTYHPDACVKQIKEIINAKPEYKGAIYKNTGNLAIKPISELRGKVILVFDEKFNHHITPMEGIHRFKKYSDGVSHIDGLSTCGTFSSSLKMSEVHKGASSAVDKHLNHPADPGHLHFVYWQQTAGLLGEKDVYKTTSAPKKDGKAWSGGAHANLSDFMTELDTAKKKMGKMPVNVISHDFVTAETCEKIIRLNADYKG